MSLTDIEKAVVELSSRHPGLTKEFLRTLLEASGWEEKHIKEAQIILSARLAMSKTEAIATPLAVALPEKKDDLTFFRPDGTEEGELVIPQEVVEKRKEEVTPVKHTETIYQEPDLPQLKESIIESSQEKIISLEDIAREREELAKKEADIHLPEESLIKEITSEYKERPTTELPENLPLVPFESSPHVWSFGRYKDTFHREEVEEKEEVPVPKKEEPKEMNIKETPTPVGIFRPTPEHIPVVQVKRDEHAPEPEIDFEKTPITKGDESLVVLAGVMLLAIMLILGYMYSNGRL